MKLETPILIILVIAFGLDWIYDGIDFKSFLFGVLSVFFAYNYKEIFKFKK